MKNLLILAVCWVAGCASQSPGALSWETGTGSPERWLEANLAADVAEVLSTHPRFRGETLAVGLPASPGFTATSLDRQLEEQLEARLLGTPGLRVLPPDTGGCGGRQAAYRIGFVTRLGDGGDRVEARVWDAVEGEWVTGVGGHWQGRLAGRAARAARTPAPAAAPPGSADRPLDAADPAPVADALAGALECALTAASLPPGPVTAQSPDERIAGLTAIRLSARLAAPDDPPAWVLAVERVPVAGRRDLVVARMNSAEGAVSASIYLTRAAAEPKPAPPTFAPAPTADPVPDAPRLAAVDCGPDCVGVRLAPATDAVLLAVLAGRGLFSLEGCETQESQGAQVVLLRERGVSWASFYGITAAVAGRGALRQLEADLPRFCDGQRDSRGADPAWLDDLARLASNPRTPVAWDGIRVLAPAGGARR